MQLNCAGKCSDVQSLNIKYTEKMQLKLAKEIELLFLIYPRMWINK